MRLSREILRKASFASILLFCGYVVLTVSLRSSKRKSIFTTEDAFASGSDQFAGMAEPGSGGSRLHLQEFRRVAVKNGRPVWEVEATDAQYYSKEGVTHLNDVDLIVHREKDSKVRLEAKSAKLLSQDEALARAELVGNIIVALDNGLVLKTELAVYDVAAGKIVAPERVEIQGKGYSIEGEELTANLEAQVIKISKNVVSVFTNEAKAPQDGFLLPGSE